MKVTITINTTTSRGSGACADEIHTLLPTVEQLQEFLTRIVPAVLPVKFRLTRSSHQQAFIEFDDE